MRSALWALLTVARPSDSPAASAESGRGVLAARSRRQGSTSTEDYATWRRGVAAELQRQHGIAFDIIPEEGWIRLYVKGLSPEQAASADEIRKYYAHEPVARLRK
jgi:hypothetical protein